MSKYTLELRHIENTMKVFNFEYDFYSDSEVIKNKFEQKFVNEYFFNEIGFETISRFKHRLKNKLNKIMPYYKQLYDTELRSNGIDFMLNKDLTETFERDIQGNSSSSSDLTVDNTGTVENLESNIDNGNASLSLENGSLTNVGKNTMDNNTSSTNSVEGVSNQKELTTLISQGNIGITSSAELLDKWRKVLINLDELIINECSDLFMQIY